MNHRELLLYWSTFAFDIVLCACVFASRVAAASSLFAAYATCALAFASVGLGLVYMHFGFRSVASYYAYWIETLLNLVARSLAIAELCRYGLRAYRGIWALVWRGPILLALFFLAHAAVDAWGQPNRLAIYGLTLERDLDVASIAILVAMLLIRKYYGLALSLFKVDRAWHLLFLRRRGDKQYDRSERLRRQPVLLVLTQITSFWPALKPQIERVNDLYGTIRLCSLMISMSIWCYALRKPLPAPAKAPELLARGSLPHIVSRRESAPACLQ